MDNCHYCNGEFERATETTPDGKSNGLTWQCPEEVWICERCLRDRIEKIPIII